MTTDDAKRVIYSHKFVENTHMYGFARRNANRALNEVDNYIKNHQFMNNYIEKRWGNGVGSSGGSGSGANSGNNRSSFSGQQQQQRGGGFGYQQTERKYGQVSMTSQQQKR